MIKHAIRLFLISAALGTGPALAEVSPQAAAAAGDYERAQTAAGHDGTAAGAPQADAYDLAYHAYITGRYKTAFDSALKRAEKGDATAQTLLAMLYMEGKCVKLDADRAMYWYGRAADAGDPQAQLRYGIDLYNGLHVPKDQPRGEEYIRKSALAGVPAAYFYYGQILMDNAPRDERFDIGLQWFLKGAVAGDANATYAASQILAEGTPRIAKNDRAARTLLETAANDGNVAAQMELAKWMVEGRGGAKDYKSAFDLMKIVSVNGIPPAQINLSRLYREGIGTKRDLIMAAAWYMVAKQVNYVAEDLDTMLASLSAEQIKQAQKRTLSLLTNP